MEPAELSPLRKYRRATGLTMEALADRVGVSPSQMSRIERKGTHSLPVALKLAGITGLPPQSFAPVDGVEDVEGAA